MPLPLIAAVAAPVAGAIAGRVLGPKSGSSTPALPKDLAPMRQQQIQLLNFLLGMGPDPRGAGGATQGQSSKDKLAGAFNGLFQGNTRKGPTGQNQQNPSGPIPLGGGFPIPAQGPTAIQQPLNTNFFGRPMAGGGMVEGPGGPTSDQVPALLSNGEGVLNAATVQILGGPEAIVALNKLGLDQMGVQRMAFGGVAGQPRELPGQPQVLPPVLPDPNAGTQQVTGPLPVTLGDPNLPTPNLPQVPNINVAGQGGGQAPQVGGGVQTPQQRLESFFGPQGVPTSGLQQSGSGALNSLLFQPTPEQRAADISLPQLQQNLSGNPSTQGAVNALMGLQTGAGADVEGRLSQLGQGNASTQNALSNLLGQSGTLNQRLEGIGNRPVTGSSGLDQILAQLAGGGGPGGGGFNPSNVGIDQLTRLASQNAGEGVANSLQPIFQRDLAAANQQGGRFGSSNALLRSTALENNQRQAADALLQGAGIQGQAAAALGQTGVGFDALRQRGQEAGQQNQLNAFQQLISGLQGKDTSALQALGQQGSNFSNAGQLGVQDQSSLANILNLLGGQRQQGQQQQGANLTNAGNLGLGQTQGSNQAANVLGQLFGGQGAAERGLAGQAFNAGAQETGQNFAAQNNVTQLLQQLLGTAQSATLGGPVINTPSGAQQGADIGGQASQLLMQFLSQQGQGGGNDFARGVASQPLVTPSVIGPR